MKKTRKVLAFLLASLLALSCLSGLTVFAAGERTSSTPATEATVTGKSVDLAFIIDSTGSMGSYIGSVRSNLTSFVEYLNEKGVDLRMSVIDYKDITSDGMDSTRIHQIDGDKWSSDVNKIIDIFSSISATGGGDELETPTDALNKIIASDYGWRETASRFAFVLTDTGFKDSGYDSSIPNMDNVIESLRNNGVQVSVVAPNSYQTAYQNLFGLTGGQFIDIGTSDYYKLMIEVADWVYDAVNQVILKHTLTSEGWEAIDVSDTVREYNYVYHYTVQVDVTNPNKLSVNNVNVSLSLPEGLESTNGKLNHLLGTIAPEQTKFALFDVTAIRRPKEQDFEYSATVTSDNTANITQYDRIFVDGENEDNNIFVFGKDTWKFPNYGEKPEPITKDYLNALIRNLSNAKQETIVSAALEGQGGHCYGMSVSSILMKVGRLSPNDFDSSANTTYALPKNDSVRNLISYYHLSQFLPEISRVRDEYASKSNREKIESLKELADKVDQGGTPAILDFWGTYDGGDLEGEPWGHTVVAYSYEKGNFKKDGTTYDSRILIYDNNYPKWTEDSCLYFNEGTNEWIIPNYSGGYWHNYLDADSIGLSTSDINLIDTSNINTSMKNYDTAIEANKQQNLIITSKSKQWKIDGTNTNGATDIIVRGSSTGSTTTGKRIVIKNTANQNEPYCVTPKSRKGISDISVMYDNYYMVGDSSSWNSISFDPNNSNANISINGGSGNFKISLTANEGYNTLSWPTIVASGTDCGNAKLAKTSNGYLLSGDNLKNVTISGKDAFGNSKNIVVDSEQNSIFIGESNGELTASIDKDNDGVYETLIATSDTNTERAQLKDLQIENVTLNPKFRSDVTNYTATVSEDVTSVKVIPTLDAGTTATLSANGSTPVDLSSNNTVNLISGKNVLELKVSGDKLLDTTYTITINRASNQTEQEVTIPETEDKPNIPLIPETGDKLNILPILGGGAFLAIVSTGWMSIRKKKDKKS